MALEQSDQPWCIRRDGKECARAQTRQEANRIIKQLQKLHPQAQFTVTYEGKSISHCADGGKPLG